MAQASTLPLPSRPQPGEGAYLSAGPSSAAPQPGDGAYLASQSRQARGRPNGGSGQREGRPPGAHVNSRSRGQGRPARGNPSQTGDKGEGEQSTPRGSRGQNRQQPPHQSSARDDLRTTLSHVRPPQLQQGALDPGAPTFTPGGSAPAAQDAQEAAGKNQRRKRNNRNRKAAGEVSSRQGDQGDGSGGSGKEAKPTPQVSGRRAAFAGTKLTKTTSRSSAVAVRPAEAKNAGGKEKKKVDEPDDLVSRLTRGLRNKPLLECPICFNSITPSQSIWSCLPPDSPLEPANSFTLQPNPITGSTSTSNHYSACYTPFHLDCIRDWANRSLEEEKKARAYNAGREGEDVAWRCPGCQKRRADKVAGCFCGRLSHPPTSTTAPHSCNDSCARKRPKCSHPCPLPCHPGPCPPCQVVLVVPCPSHHTSLTVKCSAATSNNAALSPVCDEPCSRQLSCGNKDHECEQLCHYGPCKPCDQREIAKCYCGQDDKNVECGWGRQTDKVCAELDDSGEEVTWWGKYDCGRPCERLFDCGVHPCQETCHPHPIHPLKCPSSPEVVTHCPCGQTPLSSLPGYPRPDCLAPIPTCNLSCPKTRPCGHPCPDKCHVGACPPCHEEVVKTCRCGQSQLLVPCDELRERAEAGETEVTCERVCKALRSCGRHECGRLCCPLWEQAKFKNRKQRHDEFEVYGGDDLHKCHLTCGRMLSCGLHTCPKPDHKGACGRCLQASYDELICHCGNTVIYPPVACGTTINCPYPCDRPAPPCGHPKTPHPCHESAECPPCPYLTNKPCACGKDPSVKNVRCSQDRVSCGQPCGQLLECGYHKCNKSCHRSGECESCAQVCGKPKRTCKHPCTATCHAPAKCPEVDPCQAIVTQSCACGHLQARTSCGASIGNPRSREIEQLKCNSECAVRQRNARLADALGIKAAERGLETYDDELKSFAASNHGFVKMVEGTFEDFFKGPRQSMVLPHMPIAKRTFVMALAEHYRLTRELIDQEPNRSVQICRRVDTRVPNPLLSASVNPAAPAPQSRLVTSLTAPTPGGWGKASGTIASVVAGGGGWASSSHSPVASAGNSARPSRVPTPVAPVSRESVPPSTRSRNVSPVRAGVAALQVQAAAKPGDIQGDDWDVDV
ncbi:hypothetical protein IAU60_001904 [Kwoniella sp. DSM 27419]